MHMYNEDTCHQSCLLVYARCYAVAEPATLVQASFKAEHLPLLDHSTAMPWALSLHEALLFLYKVNATLAYSKSSWAYGQ